MKKIVLIIPIILIALFLALPSLLKSSNYGSEREFLNIIPVDYNIDSAKDFVLITDEIELFKKFLVETPIDLDIAENSPEVVSLKSEDEENRTIVFSLTGSKEANISFEDYEKILSVTYDKFNGKKSLTSPFAHNKALSLKSPLMIGDKILRVNGTDKKGFIQPGAEGKCTEANFYVLDASVKATFCGISEKERDYILYTLKSAN